MAEAPDDEFSPETFSGTFESNIQPFFVLHKALARKVEKKAPAASAGKARRKIDLSPAKLRHCEGIEGGCGDGENERCMERLRMEAFDSVWSKIESTIQDVLKKFNVNLFDDIFQWVCESFEAINVCQTSRHVKANRSYPIITDAASKKISIGLVLTKNLDFVDDLLTFRDLGVHLKSHGCHVANLSSLDFSAKAGIGGCLKIMLRQFLMISSDAADISVLAAWYSEQGLSKPMVIIIDDMERCCGSVLADFILTLSEWVLKLPIVLVVGVSTTIDSARKLLPSNVLQYFSPSKFMLGSPAEKMDAIVEAVLVKQCSGFNIDYKVAAFMRSYFLRQDGTLTSFIRALKIACVQHFSRQLISKGLSTLFLVEDTLGMPFDMRSPLPEAMLKNKVVERTGEKFSHALAESTRRKNYWSSVLLCLHEAGKSDNIQLLDLFCEALDPEFHKFVASDKNTNLERELGAKMSSDYCVYPQSFKKNGFIRQAVNSVRDLHETQLSQILENWERHTADLDEINEKVKELRSIISDEGKGSLQESINASRRITSRSNLNMGKETANEKAASLIKSLVREYMRPFEELHCFENADNLQSALIGDPRRQIQVDLLDVQKILKCNCCSKKGTILLPTMHDTSILYTLAQEHGDLINLHDWYHSFKTIINPVVNEKNKKKKSGTPKKRKARDEEPASISEATIQARFCRAVTELQITGLLRMPSKRRPDYLQRVAFGL
uniref:Origin of replication complex subunit 3 n=1 Tax=Kalanchoe fedtschenkoi TaxID=63787 RepID=A0A7N0UAB5_KALFE